MPDLANVFGFYWDDLSPSRIREEDSSRVGRVWMNPLRTSSQAVQLFAANVDGGGIITEELARTRVELEEGKMPEKEELEQMPTKTRPWLEAECLKLARLVLGGNEIQCVMIRRLRPKGSGPNWKVADIIPQPTPFVSGEVRSDTRNFAWHLRVGKRADLVHLPSSWRLRCGWLCRLPTARGLPATRSNYRYKRNSATQN